MFEQLSKSFEAAMLHAKLAKVLIHVSLSNILVPLLTAPPLNYTSDECFQLYKLGWLKGGGLDHMHIQMLGEITQVKHPEWEMVWDILK